MRKGERLLKAEINSEGNINAERNSRNTQYLYPYSLAALGSEVLDRILIGLEKGFIPPPTWMDDRYCIAMAIDCFLASKEILDADDPLKIDSFTPV